MYPGIKNMEVIVPPSGLQMINEVQRVSWMPNVPMVCRIPERRKSSQTSSYTRDNDSRSKLLGRYNVPSLPHFQIDTVAEPQHHNSAYLYLLEARRGYNENVRKSKWPKDFTAPNWPHQDSDNAVHSR